MKTKIMLLLAGAAVVTLSFTYASTTNRAEQKQVITSVSNQSAPAGGFAMEEK
ncbi:MAG: hypothetical protein WKF87_19000 [Chryseolinea sp.]